MTAVLLAHGGTGGAVAEAVLLVFPVAAFLLLSRWSKRRDRARDDPLPGEEPPTDLAP